MLLSGANIRAKSFFLESFSPAEIPAKEKPKGVKSPSLINDQLVLNWLNLFYKSN